VQGLQLVAEHHPDLIVLDYMMPMLDGPGMLRALRDDPRTAAIPVVMISSLPEATVRTRADGYTAFLRKPFAFEALIGAIERVLADAGRR
jgi:CheY-like chemotaxis protein